MNTAASTAPDFEESPLFSADSHVVEDADFWDGILPDNWFGVQDVSAFHKRPGRIDPVERIAEMAVDGVHGEVLYPSLAMSLFGLEDAALQEKCFTHYNEWLAEFCATAPDKLIGVGLISCYRPENAVKELERCAQLGLKGSMIWQSPSPDLPFTEEHYNPIWEAMASLDLPMSLHILTGFLQGLDAGPATNVTEAIGQYRRLTNAKVKVSADALLDIMFTGVFEKFPGIKMVIVENEIGWLPFLLDQYDYYVARSTGRRPTGMTRAPSSYFGKELFATFFRDPVGMRMLDWWGTEGCMWSSDYPHAQSTWPNSQQVVADNLDYLAPDKHEKVIRGNARKLYGLDQTVSI